MPKPRVLSAPPLPKGPNYAELIRFLIQPLLESPTDLSVDCEQANERKRVWLRMAFEETDKGRVYGRGGRNFQAIRAVLETAAATVGQTLYLDIYDGDRLNGENSSTRRRTSYGETNEPGKFSRRRPRSRPTTESNYSA